jgi:hypothetical protein
MCPTYDVEASRKVELPGKLSIGTDTILVITFYDYQISLQLYSTFFVRYVDETTFTAFTQKNFYPPSSRVGM